jgi:hypothetical protein
VIFVFLSGIPATFLAKAKVIEVAKSKVYEKSAFFNVIYASVGGRDALFCPNSNRQLDTHQ